MRPKCHEPKLLQYLGRTSLDDISLLLAYKFHHKCFHGGLQSHRAPTLHSITVQGNEQRNIYRVLMIILGLLLLQKLGGQNT